MPRRRITTAVEGIEVKRKTVVKKRNANEMTAGEIQHKKSLAVFLRVAGYTNTEIGGALGITKGTVSAWFKDKDVQKLYDETLESIGTAAKQFLETLTIEAVKRLAALMYDSDHKIALDAVREVLDRGGIPKLSRQEKTVEDKTPGANKPQVLEVRISADQANRYAELVEEAEKITAEAAEDNK